MFTEKLREMYLAELVTKFMIPPSKTFSPPKNIVSIVRSTFSCYHQQDLSTPNVQEKCSKAYH